LVGLNIGLTDANVVEKSYTLVAMPASPRDSHRRFIFERYEFLANTLTVRLHSSLDGEIHFVEELCFDPALSPEPARLSSAELEPLLFGLHLMAGVNTYKTACPPEIVVSSGRLTPEQAAFWNLVYRRGLGEFCYVNRLDPTRLASFSGSGESPSPPAGTGAVNRPALVLLGGGKDSVVAARLLQRAGVPFRLLTLGRHRIYEEVAASLGCLPPLVVERRLPPELFRLNRAGYYNGHVPFSAQLAFISTFAAWLGGFGWVVVANEHSADSGNLAWRGHNINHQWSKSLEFEAAFQDYAARFVTSEVRYFSLLRPCTELEIARDFARLAGAAWETFTSCNRNFRLDSSQHPLDSRWCRQCPKCAFTFALLAPFTERERLVKIFGGDLFSDAALVPLYRELLGLEGHKPFECVGVPEEIALAMRKTIQRYNEEGRNIGPVLRALEESLEAMTVDEGALLCERPLQRREHRVPERFQGLA
jgi:UDP-N-acetyl-alpha-D-muramoyl-L-alanyl-L-glutamate epimerase